MSRVHTNVLFDLWKDKEKREGRGITLSEISETTGLASETIRKIRDNETKRFDASVIIALCDFFDVPPGPVPFIIYDPSEE